MFILTICLVFFVVIAALLACFEISMFSLSSITLKSYELSENKKKQKIASLMRRPKDVLVSLLLCNILINILIQNTFANLFEDSSWVYKVVVPLILVLIFGEILPKSVGLKLNLVIAPVASVFLGFLMRILKPVLMPLTKVTEIISRFLFFFLKKEQEISFSELRHIVSVTENSGVLLPEEADLIEGAIDLKDSMVRERMRPRNEILYYDINDSISQLEHIFIDLQATRVPVCDGEVENVLGILATGEYFLHQETIKNAEDLKQILKKPCFVLETMNAWSLLIYLREKGLKLAMVVDEYSSVSGLITQEDLVEAVVGEVKDRRDVKSLYTRSGSDVIVASGKLELKEFAEIFHIPLVSQSHAVTLGGWLIEQLRDIPVAGTKFTSSGFLFYVLSADPNKVKRIYVRRLKS